MIDYILSTANELLAAIPQTSLPGRVGMSLVGIYFVVIVLTALLRIKKGDHMGCH